MQVVVKTVEVDRINKGEFEGKWEQGLHVEPSEEIHTVGWEEEEELVKNSVREEGKISGEAMISDAKGKTNTKKRVDCLGYTELQIKESSQPTVQ